MKPSVGRIVHYFDKPTSEPLAAIVTGTYDDETVDLDVHQRPTSKKHKASTLSMKAVGPSTDEVGGWAWPLHSEPAQKQPEPRRWPPSQSAVDALAGGSVDDGLAPDGTNG